LKFDHVSGDGPLSLVFDAGENGNKFLPDTWKVTLAATFPAVYYASMTLGAQYNYVYPAMFLPGIYYYFAGQRAYKENLDTVQ